MIFFVFYSLVVVVEEAREDSNCPRIMAMEAVLLQVKYHMGCEVPGVPKV